VCAGAAPDPKRGPSREELAARFAALEVKLSLAPDRVLPGEPVRFTVVLRNPTGQGAPGDLDLVPGEDLGVWIRPEAGTWRYCSGSDGGVPERSPRTLDQIALLRPGGAREVHGTILATRDPSNPDVKTFAFPAPGRYEVKARVTVPVDLEGDPAAVESRPVDLLVEDPGTPGDREVWTFLRDRPGSAWFLQHGYAGNWVGDARNPELASALADLLGRLPESRYAPVLREALAKHRDLRVRHKLER
jgi:hypothetical protein